MLPNVFSLKLTAIACAACLAVGFAGGGFVAHLFYAPRLELANVKVESLGEDIRRQNAAVDRVQKAGEERAKQAETALAAAQKERDAAELAAADILSRQPKPGENRCAAASALIRQELGR